jgi:plastocyanin
VLKPVGGVPAASLASIPANAARVVAEGEAFPGGSVAVPAGAPFDLVLDNRDNEPHNVTILATESGRDPRFVGEVFSGPATRMYRVPALEAGSYKFRCDVHQSMTGTIVVS